MQVGEAFNKSKAYHELKLIASDPEQDHAFKVTNYMALDGLLNKLQESIIRVEGEAPGPWPPCGGPLSIQREARGPPSSPIPVLPPCGTLATPLTSLSLSCSISKKATADSGKMRGRNSWGVWDRQVHTAVFKMDNQQGPTYCIAHGTLLKVMW